MLTHPISSSSCLMIQKKCRHINPVLSIARSVSLVPQHSRQIHPNPSLHFLASLSLCHLLSSQVIFHGVFISVQIFSTSCHLSSVILIGILQQLCFCASVNCTSVQVHVMYKSSQTAQNHGFRIYVTLYLIITNLWIAEPIKCNFPSLNLDQTVSGVSSRPTCAFDQQFRISIVHLQLLPLILQNKVKGRGHFFSQQQNKQHCPFGYWVQLGC